MTDDKMTKVVKFLLGEEPLDGVWFGCGHPTRKGAFWWRTFLREATEEANRQHHVKTDEEMEYLCETLVDNAMQANTPIEMKGIIETALYHCNRQAEIVQEPVAWRRVAWPEETECEPSDWIYTDGKNPIEVIAWEPLYTTPQYAEALVAVAYQKAAEVCQNEYNLHNALANEHRRDGNLESMDRCQARCRSVNKIMEAILALTTQDAQQALDDLLTKFGMKVLEEVEDRLIESDGILIYDKEDIIAKVKGKS